MEFLPGRGLDNGQRDAGEHDRGLNGADRSTEFESTTRTLPWHGLRTLNESMLWFVDYQPVANGNRINAFLRPAASDGDIDTGNQRRRGAILD
jgi:hypothetical protein